MSEVPYQVKPIPNFPDYTISTEGEIFSKYKKGEKLNPYLGTRGYFVVTMYKNTIPTYKNVHRLLAETFIPNTENKPLVLHKNDIRTDNRLENLYWGTFEENMEDRTRNGFNVKGERNCRAKLTAKQVNEIRQRYIPRKVSSLKLAKEYNVSKCTILEIINYKTWRHI